MACGSQQVQDVSIEAMGPGWRPGASTFHFDNVGMPEFDGPETWGCLTMGKGDLGVFHVNCINDGGTFPTDPSGSGGSIIIFGCEAGCDITEARDKLAQATRFVDPREPSQLDLRVRTTEPLTCRPVR